jgi:GDP-L-fucose synthase
MNFFKDKKVLVTGGAGFIGSNLVKKLVECEAQVRATVHVKCPRTRIKGVDYVEGVDLLNKTDCGKVTKEMDYVFLCAANTSGAGVMEKTPLVHLTPNVVMNAQMLEGAYLNKVRKVLFVSSTSIYPLTDYPVKEKDVDPSKFFPKYHIVAWMKYFTEQMCYMYSHVVSKKMKTVIVRPGNVYGPGDDFEWETSHVIPALIRRVVERHDPVVVWGNGEDVKDFIYIDDLVDGMLLAMEKTGKTVNISTGESVSLLDVLFEILRIVGDDSIRIVFDETKPVMIPKRLVDVSRIKSFGFDHKVYLEEGLRRTIEWYRGTQK